MPTTAQNPTDTSVTFSLAELARLEEERVREQQLQQTRLAEERARQRRAAEEQSRADERARIVAETEARARAAREEAEAKALVEARQQAALDVARIQAEAKARLEADDAVRAHELATIRARAVQGNQRVQTTLAAALGLVLCGSAILGFDLMRRGEHFEEEAAHLRSEKIAIADQLDDLAAAELGALDRREAALRTRAMDRAEEASAGVDQARSAIGTAKAPDQAKLAAYGRALEALQARLDGVERTARLDRRRADLASWAAQRRRTDVMAAAESAAIRARAPGAGDAALHAYEAALDAARDKLAETTNNTTTPVLSPKKEPTGSRCTDPKDPMCGLDGRSL